MPLTAMSDMPDALQGLKRENLLGYEHVLAPNMWDGDGDAMAGLAADAWSPPAGAPTGIPLASGMQLQVPNFNDPALQNPGSIFNYGVYAASTLLQNKQLNKQQQDAAHHGKTPPTAAGGGGNGSGFGEISPYMPYLIVGGVVLVVGALALKSRKGE